MATICYFDCYFSPYDLSCQVSFVLVIISYSERMIFQILIADTNRFFNVSTSIHARKQIMFAIFITIFTLRIHEASSFLTFQFPCKLALFSFIFAITTFLTHFGSLDRFVCRMGLIAQLLQAHRLISVLNCCVSDKKRKAVTETCVGAHYTRVTFAVW